MDRRSSAFWTQIVIPNNIITRLLLTISNKVYANLWAVKYHSKDLNLQHVIPSISSAGKKSPWLKICRLTISGKSSYIVLEGQVKVADNLEFYFLFKIVYNIICQLSITALSNICRRFRVDCTCNLYSYDIKFTSVYIYNL